MRPLPCLALTLLLVTPCADTRAEWVEWIADASLATEFDDNVSRTGVREEEETDVVFRPTGAFGRIYQAGDRTRLVATVDVRGALHARFEELDHVDLGGTLSALRKLGLGREAPWARAHLSAWHRNFRDDRRDSWFLETGLAAGRRLTPRLDLSVGWRYVQREGRTPPRASPGFSRDVYDQAGHHLRLAASYALLEPLLLSGGVGWYTGDFESSCPLERTPRLDRIRPRAVALDGVFGDADDCIYRIDGDIASAFLDLELAVTRRVALGLGYRFHHGDGRRLDYQTHVAGVTLSYRH